MKRRIGLVDLRRNERALAAKGRRRRGASFKRIAAAVERGVNAMRAEARMAHWLKCEVNRDVDRVARRALTARRNRLARKIVMAVAPMCADATAEEITDVVVRVLKEEGF